ncbi:SWIM zinc finger family protein [Prescottella defluvii]|uniref:SWIM zinc finger family protein n=1 Tax=Prescottella defluvii TaxID=1323361 RepID=UPI0004F27751|nr:SWIM zinc finger family protein [Prescottella defluvii]
MTEPWSSAQVAAAAPDAASLSAARGLATKWTDTGRTDTALWGSCGGSGKNPYLAAVDLTGPAYRCSCPSRKFPCKHAVSLLLRWSDGAVPAADAPGFVTDWLATREARAAATSTASAQAAPAESTPDPASTERRLERISAGLDELDRWLTDRIVAGLGSVAHDTAAYDAIAARMVDAQAPGVAASLRALPALVATDPDWPAPLLAAYGRLHLLIRAFRDRDRLPEPLNRSVQTHLGIPVRADEVRAQPAVRDRWQVLAVRAAEEGRLVARRTWLRGRDSGRWALLLDFAHGSAQFSTAAKIPGTIVDADVHYYPGAAPLRAHLGTQHCAPEPFTTLPGATDPAAALDGYTAALAGDPWIRSWPMLLADVAPTVTAGTWHVVDRAGRALPVGDDTARWQLLAVSGGHPVTVCGDWDGTALQPASVFDAGTVISL